ncbi:hypothetical protein QBC44DRAFT_368682 [Cladorrhinum sp. PSN332]|nr:hypothetical protein QBC44DRAFT_368682 [Cladorrhinum sp. PSN332]
MQFTSSLLISAAVSLFSLSSATPLPTPVQDVESELWTIHALRRICDPFDAICTWNFQIHNNIGRYAPVPCSVPVREDKEDGKSASRNHAEDFRCGPFSVSVGWSGRFGLDKGYTTLSVVDHEARLVVHPAYTDVQVVDGNMPEDQHLTPRPFY